MSFVWRNLVVVASLMLFGCWGSVPSEHVYGTYVASSSFGTEALVLNRDGSYEQGSLSEARHPSLHMVRGVLRDFKVPGVLTRGDKLSSSYMAS